MDLLEFLEARAREDGKVITEAVRGLPTAPDESGDSWPHYEAQIDRRGHSSVAVSPVRAEEDYMMRRRTLMAAGALAEHADPDVRAMGRAVLLIAAQAYQDHPDFDPRWLITDGMGWTWLE